jgi:hypothetical protein
VDSLQPGLSARPGFLLPGPQVQELIVGRKLLLAMDIDDTLIYNATGCD